MHVDFFIRNLMLNSINDALNSVKTNHFTLVRMFQYSIQMMFNTNTTYMKKIILTACAAALFGIGAMAQGVQDTTSINQNLRSGAQEVEQETQEAGNQLRDNAEETGDEMKRDAQDAGNDIREGANDLRDGARETGQDIEQGAEEAGNEIRQGAENTGNEIEERTENAGDRIEQGAERTGNEIEQGAERTGDQIQRGAQDVKDEVNGNDNPSSMNNNMNNDAQSSTQESAMATPPQPAEIEVVKDKEGPNNEVVYKYQGGMYYVDREQKQLVEIDESQLQDAEHEAIISNSGDSDNK